MDHALLSALGYAAIVGGTILEGETVLIAAGLAAGQGYLYLPLVVLSAWVGATSGDHFFYMLGRYKGESLARLRPSWSGRIAKALELVGRYGTFLVFGARFMYGLRAVAPFAIGAAHVRARKFVFLDLFAGLVWASLFGLVGYLSGTAAGSLVEDARSVVILVAVLVCLAVIIVYRRSIARNGRAMMRNLRLHLGLTRRLLRARHLS